MNLQLKKSTCIAFLYVYALCISGYTFMKRGVGFISYTILIGVILYGLCRKMNVRFDKGKFYLFVLGVYAICLQIFHYYWNGKNSVLITNALIIIITVFILFFLPHIISIIKFEELCRVYENVAVMCSVGVIIQFLEIYLFHGSVEQICILPSSWLFIEKESVMRPVSIFTEPSAYGNFAAIAVIMALYEKKRKLAFYLSGTIALSTSLLGIIIVAFIYLYKKKNQGIKIRLNTILTLTMLIFAIIALISILRVGGLEFARYYRSFQIRVLNGFEIMKRLNFSQWMLGIGSGNVVNTIQQGEAAFLSGVTSVLINYGVIEFLLFGLFIINLIVKNKRDSFGRMIGWIIVILSLGQSMFLNFKFLMWLSVYYFFYYHERAIGKGCV